MVRPEYLKNFGVAVKKRRLDLGMSYSDLAESAGLSLSQISKIETGNSNPSMITLHAIAKALKTKSSKLLDF